MLLIHCPFCQMDRPEIEFRHAGQADIARPDPLTALDEEWTAFLYLRDNRKGRHAERWCHTHGCGRYFNAVRDTVTDQIAATYRPGEPAP